MLWKNFLFFFKKSKFIIIIENLLKGIIIIGNSDDFKWFLVVYKNILEAVKIPRFSKVVSAILNLLINQFSYYWLFYNFSFAYTKMSKYYQNKTEKLQKNSRDKYWSLS